MVVISLIMGDRIHGTQQQPHVTKIPQNTAKAVKQDNISVFHLPKALVNHSSSGLLTPECSCMVLESIQRPSNARVTEPSGAVLLGMTVQHISPNIEQTPPLSASNMSRAMRFLSSHDGGGCQLFCESGNRVSGQIC